MSRDQPIRGQLGNNQTLDSAGQADEAPGQQTLDSDDDDDDDEDTEDREDESTDDDTEEEPRVIQVKVPKPLDPGVEDREDIPDEEEEVTIIANFTQFCAPVTARYTQYSTILYMCVQNQLYSYLCRFCTQIPLYVKCTQQRTSVQNQL